MDASCLSPAPPHRVRIARALARALAWLALCTLLAPMVARGDDGPIVLTNEDIARTSHGGGSAAGRAANGGSSGRLILVDRKGSAESPAKSPEHNRVEDDSDNRFDGPARTWQDEYYRLKALALRRALERGESIHLGEDPSPPAAPVAVSSTPPPQAGRLCVWGAKDELLHSPAGVQCRR